MQMYIIDEEPKQPNIHNKAKNDGLNMDLLA